MSHFTISLSDVDADSDKVIDLVSECDGVLCTYNDPTAGGVEDCTADYAKEVGSEDPGLVYFYFEEAEDLGAYLDAVQDLVG